MTPLTIAIAALLSLGPAEKNIYHKGWIDFNKNGRKDIYENPKAGIEDRVEDLLSRMTVEEKSCQLATLYGAGRVLKDPLPTDGWKDEIWADGLANIDEQLNGVGKGGKKFRNLIYPFSSHVKALNTVQRWFVENTRLGIPVEFSNEGIHGLNHRLATPLPAPIAIGSTWDRELVREAGRIAGKEASLLGYHSVYAPILDIARDQRWGRTLECYGEDPFVVAELGVQMASGIQEQGVASCLKHYVAYGVPKGGRDADCRTDPHITPRELHELYLYTFRRVIEEAHPMEVMSSYNDWNGEPVSASHYFLTELLRDTYGFDGYVVSDSDAVEFVHTKHKVADSYDEAVRQVLEAGLNVRTNFTQPKIFIEAVRRLVADGRLPEETLDRRVREVLRVKFRLGLFDNPFTGNGMLADAQAGHEKHAGFVKRMGRESVVLLKNENHLLPLDKKAFSRILVTGPLADEDNFMTSRYGPDGIPTVTMLAGIKEYLKGSGITVDYEKGCKVKDAHWPLSEIIPEPLTAEEEEGIRKAVEKAAEADIVIAVMGEDVHTTGESRSRTSLDLPGRQRELLRALHETGKPIVLVLINGQPLTINWEDKYLPAILEMWFPNNMGGTVLAETLFGDNNPGGKLTVTFPKAVGQIETNFPYKKGSEGGQGRIGDPNGWGVTRVVGPLYPFGYGLSYTDFSYSGLKVENKDGGTVEVWADISNTGKYEGDEVVQLYIRDRYSSVVTYDSVLRGFERVSLKPGETTRVHFTLTEKDLMILDKNMEWKAEPGEFEVLVGSSSTDIRLQSFFPWVSAR
ncbi:MAG: glycoside hydrolase family 3 C-terminal domain-containing protein [Bacteroidales bacterium]|nr:glycoside hydrolase family 3 C-terminal domain-containing protein [Bacteroidales bacterium]